VEELCAELVDRLREATRVRLVADVPVGAFLSGGIDSSAVVAMMAEVSGAPVRTFTVGFAERAYDERRFARMVAERYGTRHEELVVEPDGAAIIEDLVYHYGEPYADSSALPSYFLSRFTREHVTVALNGDGGDESFLGYNRYLACREWDERGPAPGDAGDPPSRRYGAEIAYFLDAMKGPLYGERMRGFLAGSALARLDAFFAEAPTATAGAAWADIHTYLPDDLLVKMDVASMAHSLEVRSPFLDHTLMEWAATIPDAQKLEGSSPKALLKRAMEPYLPAEVLHRPKMGFSVPVAVWLRDSMRDFTRHVLLSGPATGRGLFDLAEVRRLLEEPAVAGGITPALTPDQRRPVDRQAWRVWALLMLELWFRMWIDTDDAFRHPTAARIGARGLRR
jgi:asparagine synthase (glutamine-hydrolysing)